MASEHALIRAISRFSRSSISKSDEHVALHRARSRALIDLLNELRTPLMMIKSPFEANRLEDGFATEELLDHANRIQSGLEKALEILEMDLTLEDAGASTDIASAVDRYVASLQPLADRCAVTIVYSSDVSRALVPMHLPQVQHLLETITEKLLAAAAGGGHVCITLAAGTKGNAFVVSFEVQCAERRGGELRSLEEDESRGDTADPWLDLARSYVYNAGGELSASVNHRKITLPAEEVAYFSRDDRIADETEALGGDGRPAYISSAARSEDRAPADGSDMKTSVLIVDDHAGTRAYLRYALRKHHRVLEAADGGAGLEVVRKYRPDLVISDIMMPIMDGNELCRAIKDDEDLAHIPVFLVTANSMPSVKARSLENGADDYLVKPFDVSEVVMRINNEIKSRRDLRRQFSRQIVIKPSEIDVTSEDEALIKRATEIVELNMENGDFSVQELAAEVGLSSRQLQRKLREIADQSPVEFIRNLRLQRAAQLLEARWGNVSEVAYSVGFTSLSYFAKCFKEEFGESPSVYKEKENAV